MSASRLRTSTGLRTIYLAGQTGIDANGKVAEGFRAQGVQGADAFASPGAEVDWSCEDQADWSKRVDVALGGGSGVSHKVYEIPCSVTPPVGS